MEEPEDHSVRIRHETKPKSYHSSRSRPVSQSGRSARSSGRSSAAGSVPPLWDLESSLKVQSTPVSLATRSLSSRSSASATSATKPSIPSSRKRGTGRTRNQDRPTQHTATANPPSSSKNKELKSEETTTVATGTSTTATNATATNATAAVATGFNIASHLRDVQAGGGVVDRSSGSISPEVDQFLQDINAAIRSITPDTKQPRSAGGTSSGQSRRGTIPSPSLTMKEKTTPQSNEHPAHTNQNPPHSPSPEPAVYLTSDGSDSEATAAEREKERQHQATAVAAATTIQRWYRGTSRHRQQQVMQVQRLLHSKKVDLDRSRAEETAREEGEAEGRQRREEDRERRRRAKMQEARRTAIEGLQRKREEKRKHTERIAHEEIALLQASGKIKRPRTSQRKKTRSEKHKASSGSAERKDNRSGESSAAPKEKSSRGDSKSTSEDVINQFFDAGKVCRSKAPPQPPHAMQPTPPLTTGNDPKTTYSDILETLKLLEEVPEPLSSSEQQVPLVPPHSSSSSAAYLSSFNLAQLRTPHHPPPPPPLPPPEQQAQLSEGKLQSILTYLEQMEQADSELLSRVSRTHHHSLPQQRTSGRGGAGSGRSGTKPPPTAAQQSELTDLQATATTTTTDEVGMLGPELQAATAVASDVTSTILTQRLELENKDKTVDMLQKALSQQRELTVYHAKEMDKEGSRRLALQKKEYEDTIQRHQCFIDQLIDDKKVLSERCEKLVKELREVDAKCKQKVKALTDSHAAELAKVKQVSATADKLRREKWRTEETQRIKEVTVKSLEPEIQRIIAKGKAEIQKLKALHEAEMLQMDERAGRRFVAQMEELRAQCAAEKEQACSHERELARQRFEKLAEQEELNYQQQRRRLYADVQQEKDKLATQFHQQKEHLEQRYREMQHEQDKVVEELKSDHERAFGESERRRASELREVRERAELERQAWEENLLRKQEATLLARERELRETLRRERDKEIELVITRLEEETAHGREEGERALEGRIRRVRDKYETELREVERSERTTLEKFNSMKLQVVELDSEVSRVQALLRQREQEVQHVSQVAAKLTSERDHVADVVRQEFADRLVSTEETNKQLKIEMSELRARHKIELERVGTGKEREMEAVHERIKQALARKEENLRSLRQQYDAANRRAEHLEMLLERQRKQLLTK